MKVFAGVWLDRKKAVIVFLIGGKDRKIILDSGLDKIFQTAGKLKSTNPYGRRDETPDDIKERVFKGHLNNYFDRVLSAIKDVSEIYIFGPGETKNELVKRGEKQKLNGKIVRVETSDKMTGRQITAKVRKFFVKRLV